MPKGMLHRLDTAPEPNKALQRTAAVHRGCNPGFSAPLSLSFLRWANSVGRHTQSKRKCMKLLYSILTLSVSASAQVFLTDDFSGGVVDSSKWSVILPGSNSTIVQSGGFLTTTARGVLGSVSNFSAPYSISGSFRMLDGLEHFNVVLRSDLSGSDYFERRGVLVSFSNDGDQISIQRYTNASDTSIITQASYPLATGQAYSFSISDDGFNVTLSVDGIAQLSGATSYSTGHQIGFYSREFGTSATSLDFVSVAAVPEPSFYGTAFALACLGVAISTNRAQQGAGANRRKHGSVR